MNLGKYLISKNEELFNRVSDKVCSLEVFMNLANYEFIYNQSLDEIFIRDSAGKIVCKMYVYSHEIDLLIPYKRVRFTNFDKRIMSMSWDKAFDKIVMLL